MNTVASLACAGDGAYHAHSVFLGSGPGPDEPFRNDVDWEA